MPRPQEIELKLEVPKDCAGRLERLPFLKSATSAHAETLRSVYFDTDKQKLRKNGLSLRVRSDHGHYRQTIKQGRGGTVGLFERGEWETELAGRQPDLDAAQGSGLRPFLSKKLRHAVSDTVPVTLATQSKAGRGYDLIAKHGNGPVRSEAIALDPDADWATAFRIIARGCLYQIAANQAALHRGDAEALHQMRIGIRRMRAAVSVFKEMLAGPQTRGPKLAELKTRQRHKLRINAKKLRYACEFFAGAFPGKKSVVRREKFVAKLKDLQDALGDLNDIKVHEELAKAAIHRPRLPKTKRRAPEAFAAGRLAGRESARFAHVMQGAERASRKFAKAKPFWA